MFIGVVLLFFGVLALVGFKIVSEYDDFVQTNSDMFDSHGVAASTSVKNTYTGAIDNGFLLLTFGMAIATLALALMVRIHPIFIPFFLIGLVIVIILAGVMSNIYQEMAENPVLASEASQLVFIDNILSILPMFVGIFGFLLMILMYKLWKADQVI